MYYNPLEFTRIPAFTKVSVSQTVCINIPLEQFSFNSFFSLLKQEHNFPWLLFCFKFYTAVQRWRSASIWMESLYIVVLSSAKCSGSRLRSSRWLCCRSPIRGGWLAGVCETVAKGCQVLSITWGHQVKSRKKETEINIYHDILLKIYVFSLIG